MVVTYEHRGRPRSVIILVFLANLNTYPINASKDTNEFDFIKKLNYSSNYLLKNHEIFKQEPNQLVPSETGLLEGLLESGDKKNRKKEINGSYDVNLDHLEIKRLNKSLNKLLKEIKTSPRREKVFQTWLKPESHHSNAVRPMIRYAEREKPQKVDFDTLIDVILQNLVKPKKKKHHPDLEDKKWKPWRAGLNHASSSTENYERRMLKDFFTILGQLYDMGISIKQMDQLSKQPQNFKRFGDSLDERESIHMIGNLIDNWRQIPKEAKSEGAQIDMNMVREILDKDKNGNMRRGLLTVLDALKSFE